MPVDSYLLYYCLFLPLMKLIYSKSVPLGIVCLPLCNGNIPIYMTNVIVQLREELKFFVIGGNLEGEPKI